MGGRDLVTGGAGFIGSHLVDELLRRGRRVTVFDDLSTGRRENLAHLDGRDDVEVVLGSVADAALVCDLLREHERVFHLAAAVGVRLVIEQPVRTIRTNVGGAANVLEAAARHGRPVVITSTSEVYGKSSALPFEEGADVVLGPTAKRRWAYACSKLVDEFLALAHRIETGLPVVIARVFNTIGPRQTGRYGMVVPTFVGQALEGKPLSVFGDGSQRRCFCDVADVARALVDLIECDAAVGEVVNLGSTESVSIEELAHTVIDVTGSSSVIEHVPYEEAYPAGFEDMSERLPDIRKAGSLIGFRPRIDLRTSIRRIAAAAGPSGEATRARRPGASHADGGHPSSV
jgi:UDP-glucose 4-epimerase